MRGSDKPMLLVGPAGEDKMTMFLSALLIAVYQLAAIAEGNALTQAVRFALTATDDAKLRVIDSKRCVFRTDVDTSSSWQVFSQIFHLNNVHVDRIRIQPLAQVTWKNIV